MPRVIQSKMNAALPSMRYFQLKISKSMLM